MRRVNSTAGVGRALIAWDELMVSKIDPTDPPAEFAVQSRSVLRPGIADSDISAAEVRLGLQLPPSYRAFLMLSNGAYADPEGPVPAGAGDPSVGADFGLHPIEAVRHLRDADPDFFQIWTDLEWDANTPISYEGADVATFQPLRRGALLIGAGYQTKTLLVRVGRGREWQLWWCYKEGARGWSSFGSWLDDTAFPKTLPSVEDLMAKAAEGDSQAQGQLWGITDPVVLPQLIQGMGRYPNLASLLAYTISRIDGDDAARALERYLSHPRPRDEPRALRPDEDPDNPNYVPLRSRVLRVTQLLQTMRSPVAAELLENYGAHYELAQRGDDTTAARLAIFAVQHDLVGPSLPPEHTFDTLADPTYLPYVHEALARAQATDPSSLFSIGSVLANLGDPAGIDVLRDIAAQGSDHAQNVLASKFSNGAIDPTARRERRQARLAALRSERDIE